jgi:hypothetical protein
MSCFTKYLYYIWLYINNKLTIAYYKEITFKEYDYLEPNLRI